MSMWFQLLQGYIKSKQIETELYENIKHSTYKTSKLGIAPSEDGMAPCILFPLRFLSYTT